MSRTSLNFVLVTIVVLLENCNNVNKPVSSSSTKKPDSLKQRTNSMISKNNEDSIELTDLVKKMYKWHVTDTSKIINGFAPLKRNPSDTLYSGIDLDENKKAIDQLKQTGFFSDDFLNDYRKIAVRMDKELRDGTSLWPEGELSTFGDDSDAWCNCQDFPVDDYWRIIRLTDIKINSSEASFKWTWGDSTYYKVKAKKENDNWKISYLQGFDMNAYSWEWWKKNKK